MNVIEFTKMLHTYLHQNYNWFLYVAILRYVTFVNLDQISLSEIRVKSALQHSLQLHIISQQFLQDDTVKLQIVWAC